MRWPLRFCPDCGGVLDPVRAEPGLIRQDCPHCRATHWRNPKPCAGILMVRDGRVLLARRAVNPAKDHWDIVGGFLAPGETPAEGAAREALEETGLRATPARFLGAYVDRYGQAEAGYLPDATLNLYFMGPAGPGEAQPRDDVAALDWIDPARPPAPLAFPHLAQVLTAAAAALAGSGEPPVDSSDHPS